MWLDKALDSNGDVPGSRLAPLRARARLRWRLGDLEGARRDAQECADLARQLGEVSHLAAALTILGVLCSTAGDSKGAERFYLEVVQITEKAGDRVRMAGALNNLALDDSARGNHEAANVRIDQALVEVQKTDDRISITTILESAGRIERRSGAYKTARRSYLEALAISFEVEHVMNVADIFDGLALLALTNRDATRALVLGAAGTRQLAGSGSERSPSDEGDVKQCLEQARAILGQPAARRSMTARFGAGPDGRARLRVRFDRRTGPHRQIYPDASRDAGCIADRRRSDQPRDSHTPQNGRPHRRRSCRAHPQQARASESIPDRCLGARASRYRLGPQWGITRSSCLCQVRTVTPTYS